MSFDFKPSVITSDKNHHHSKQCTEELPDDRIEMITPLQYHVLMFSGADGPSGVC